MGDLRGLGVLGPDRFRGLGVLGPLARPTLSLGSVGGESGSGGVLGGLEAFEAVEAFDNFLAGIIVGGGGEGDLGSSRFRFLALA